MISMRLNKLQDEIGYKFKNVELLQRALVHGSYGDGRRKIRDNERLEFLGDRVLGLVTAEFLFHLNEDAEGQLARRLNALVKKQTCAKIARDLNLGEYLLLSKSEDKQGGRDKTSILGDACEALIAAIYLDGGLEPARAFFHSQWQEPISKVVKESAKDPKTELQEAAATHGYPPPKYEVIDRKGPDHKPHFVVEVSLDDELKSQGEGTSKKEAQRAAADALLRLIKDPIKKENA